MQKGKKDSDLLVLAGMSRKIERRRERERDRGDRKSDE